MKSQSVGFQRLCRGFLDFILQSQLKRLFEKKAEDDFQPHVSSKHFGSPFAISLFISVKKDLSMRFGEVGDEISEVQQRSARSSTEGQGMLQIPWGMRFQLKATQIQIV